MICSYELFHTRYSLFKQVYSHRVSKSIEYMICDVFKLADPVLHLSAATSSPEEYAKLTDCVLKQIEISTDPRLAEARHLIMRIRTRQLYKLVDETVLPVEVPTVLGEVTATQILDCYPPSRALLSEDDLHVQNLRINYAMKDKNPVDKSVGWRDARVRQQRGAQIDALVPAQRLTLSLVTVSRCFVCLVSASNFSTSRIRT